ncbi:hypothetical protein CsSME_00043341 [Camellia sinensis var. sinensis]
MTLIAYPPPPSSLPKTSNKQLIITSMIASRRFRFSSKRKHLMKMVT